MSSIETKHTATAAPAIRTQLKPVYAELRDSSVARVYLADAVDGVLAQRDNQHALLLARNAELSEALETLAAAAWSDLETQSKTKRADLRQAMDQARAALMKAKEASQ